MGGKNKGKSFWGPPYWTCVHVLCSKYKPSQKDDILIVILYLMYLMICEICRDHLKQIFKEFPPDQYLTNADSLFLWSYMIHDKVNKTLGKTSPSLAEMKKKYYSMTSDDYANSFWIMIHATCIAYRPKTKNYMKSWLQSLINILPDQKWKKSSHEYIKTVDINMFLKCREDMLFWSYCFHDYINDSVGKKSPSYREVKSYYLYKIAGEDTKLLLEGKCDMCHA